MFWVATESANGKIASRSYWMYSLGVIKFYNQTSKAASKVLYIDKRLPKYIMIVL